MNYEEFNIAESRCRFFVRIETGTLYDSEALVQQVILT